MRRRLREWLQSALILCLAGCGSCSSQPVAPDPDVAPPTTSVRPYGRTGDDFTPEERTVLERMSVDRGKVRLHPEARLVSGLGTTRFRTPSVARQLVWTADTLVATGFDGLSLFDAGSGVVRGALRADAPIVSLSRDGKSLALGTGMNVELRRLGTDGAWSLDGRWWLGYAVTAVAISPDGELVVAGSLAQGLAVYSARSGKSAIVSGRSPLGHSRALAFSPDGTRLVEGGEQGLALYEVTSGLRYLASIEGPRVESVRVSGDGKSIAAGRAGGNVSVCDTDGRTLHTLTGLTKDVESLTFLAGDALLAAADGEQVAVWDLRGGSNAPVRTIAAQVWAVAASPDGRTLAWGPRGAIRFQDALGGEAVTTVPDASRSVDLLGLEPDRKRAALLLDDGQVLLWGPDAPEARLPHATGARALYFAREPGGRTLAAGLDETKHAIRVWDPSSGEALHRLEGHTEEINGLAFSPDGRRLASASGGSDPFGREKHADATVRTWDLDRGVELTKQAGPPKGALGVAFSPDGRSLAAGGEGALRVCNVDDGANARVLATWAQGRSLQFSPDGRRLACAGGWCPVEVWTGAEVRRWDRFPNTPPTPWITSLDFSPDGARLAFTGDGRHGAWVWELQGEWLARQVLDLNALGDVCEDAAWLSPTRLLVRTTLGMVFVLEVPTRAS